MALRIGQDPESDGPPSPPYRVGEWEWWRVLQAVEDGDAHPSPDYLAALVRKYGVPQFARGYVAGRTSAEIAPSGRPTTYHPPTSWERHHDGLSFRQSCAVWDLERVHALLAAYETRNRSIGRHGARFRWLHHPVRFRYIESRGVWRVREPKVQALQLVARRYHVAPSTLEDWAREAP